MKKLLILIIIILCANLHGATYKDWLYDPEYRGITTAKIPNDSTLGLDHMITIGKADEYGDIGFNWLFTDNKIYNIMISNECYMHIYDTKKPKSGKKFNISGYTSYNGAIVERVDSNLSYVTIPYTSPGFTDIINILTNSSSFTISLRTNDGSGNEEEIGRVTLSSLGFAKSLDAWEKDKY